jgi:hypothetical protein
MAATSILAVSVVLPVYNGERWLRESVQSVLGQTFRDFELIAIDDGSTDDSPRVLAELAAADSRVRVHTNPRNLGLIPSLNRGFALARGRYIARLDADDVALPTRLERQVARLEAEPRLGVVGSAYYRLDEQGRRRLSLPPLSDTAIRWQLLFGNVWCHSTIMLRASLLAGAGDPYSDHRHAEDYELWVRLLRTSRGETLREPLVLYREHGGSVSREHRTAQIAMVDRIASAQLATLLPGLETANHGLQALRRARRAMLKSVDAIEAVGRILDLFPAFARQPGIDAREARRLERRWIEMVCSRAPAGALRRLARSGHLTRLVRRAPSAAAAGLLLGRGRRLADHLARRVRA